MSFDKLVNECERLAVAYVIASADDDKGNADSAFHKLLVAVENLKLDGQRHLASKILVDALQDAMHASADAQRDALNAQRSVA